GPATAAHTFTTSGTYTVTLTATDKDGAASTLLSRTVTISDYALQADPADPTKTNLVVGGTTANDTITLAAATGGAVKVTVNGTVLGTFTPTGRVLVFAQA